jgi:HlyD family secretion protein
VTLAASRPAEDSASDSGGDPDKQDVQGVFVVRNKKAIFVPVETGITGVTDIEVLTGLQQGDQIITGSYKALRTIKPGTSVKVDNSAPKVPEENQS